MIDTLLSFIAPHHCSGCGEIGSLLCPNCKYDIEGGESNYCVVCAQQITGPDGVCRGCASIVERAWMVGERSEVLRVLIDQYKFERVRATGKVLADLLADRLPELPHNVVIVPTPTVSSHIRRRGYDHIGLVAASLARRRHVPVARAIERRHSKVQLGSSRKDRIRQAETAFACRQLLDSDTIYLIIDDVVTTGATVQSMAKCLREAGATQVWVAVVAHQPLA